MTTKLLVALAISLAGANAGVLSSISILSGADLTGTTQWNDRTGANVLINAYPEPIWKAPSMGGQWISYALTGQGQQSVPDGDLSSPTATFFSVFTLPGSSVAGDLWVWSDDTAEVWLDQTLLIPLASPATRGYWCTAEPIGCTLPNGGHASLAGLSAGAHTLEIRAYQLWGDTFGVLYEGSASYDPLGVPEPATFVLMTIGLLLVLLATKGCQRIHVRCAVRGQEGRANFPARSLTTDERR